MTCSPWWGGRGVVSLLGLLALAGGCSTTPATGIVLEIDSDLAVPADLDHVSIDVSAAGRSVYQIAFPVDTGAGAHPLPVRMGLQPADDGTGSISVLVIGLHGTTEVLRRRVDTGFIKKRSLLLHIRLSRECTGKACGTDLTCLGGGVCGDPHVDPGALPPYDPNSGAGRGGDAAGAETAQVDVVCASGDRRPECEDSPADPIVGVAITPGDAVWTIDRSACA